MRWQFSDRTAKRERQRQLLFAGLRLRNCLTIGLGRDGVQFTIVSAYGFNAMRGLRVANASIHSNVEQAHGFGDTGKEALTLGWGSLTKT